ncbi:allograft inflammatory factor 1-like [Ptychodera flava]|uniref:allograft inflammatory factor 1-like n=1 Tax=Ptychodera flava TaxID=63121 RepID=UPI00396A7121
MTTAQDHQGGKAWGQLKRKQAEKIDEENQEIIREDIYVEVEDLEEKLESFKVKFIDFDVDDSGDLGIMDLKLMMEKLGQAKTHLELKKMIAEIDTNNSGTINYREFVSMMLGKKNSILKIILMFEEKAKANNDKPKGPPPKKTFDDLP